MKFSLGLGDFRGSTKAPLNGDKTTKRFAGVLLWLDGGKFADGIGGQVSEKARQAIIASIPLGALGNPADVANAVVFLSSREARYITGDALSVDGGWKL